MRFKKPSPRYFEGGITCGVKWSYVARSVDNCIRFPRGARRGGVRRIDYPAVFTRFSTRFSHSVDNLDAQRRSRERLKKKRGWCWGSLFLAAMYLASGRSGLRAEPLK
jgi:hypothetical protein